MNYLCAFNIINFIKCICKNVNPIITSMQQHPYSLNCTKQKYKKYEHKTDLPQPLSQYLEASTC